MMKECREEGMIRLRRERMCRGPAPPRRLKESNEGSSDAGIKRSPPEFRPTTVAPNVQAAERRQDHG